MTTIEQLSLPPRPLRECLCGCDKLEALDLSSRDGFITRLWGPEVHSFCHVTSWYWDHKPTSVATDGRAAMVDILECFETVIYCVFCREHYGKYVSHSPPRQAVDGQLHMWTLRLHNAINTRQHKLTFPESLYKTVYVDTCEAEAWAAGHVSTRWLFWFWTILYLTGLNHPPHLQQFEPRHLQIQVATDRLLRAMARVIPVEAKRFRSAFASALANVAHQWSLYFAWLRCELGVDLARSLPAHSCISFHTRERAFHFMHDLELETIRLYAAASSTPPSSSTTAAITTSVFGSTCLDVATYFERTYRVKPH